MRRRRPWRACAGACWLPLVVACGGSSTGASATAPQVLRVTPSSGTAFGGTVVTIGGANFSSAASVTIGGAAAVQVTVVDSRTIMATTSAHAAGAATVVVTADGQRGSLAGGFTYVSPGPITNTPPVISTISVNGAGPDEPAQYATLDEAVTVTALVSDAEPPMSPLTYTWSADTGTFAGSGATVTWTAPHAAHTPRTVSLRLTVIERYQTPDAQGLPVMRENQGEAASDVRLHDSVNEVNVLAVDFLTGFSQQLDVAYVMRNFTSRCPGTAAEWGDVQKGIPSLQICIRVRTSG